LPSSGERRTRHAERFIGPLYALPAVGLVATFIAYPLGSLVYHSFSRWNALTAPIWVGLSNYRELIHDPLFQTALRNNLLFAISVPVQVIGALVLAYLIHEEILGWRVFRSLFFLPAVFSIVVVGVLANITLQYRGPLNTALGAVGLGFLKVNWLASATSAIPMITVAVIWANFGYSVLIYLAGMSTLDPELAEAARVDGAGPWRVLRRVYVPNLRRVMELVLVINTIVAFAAMLTYVYTITSGGPGFSTFSVEYLIYNTAFTFQQIGYASAMGVVLTLILLAFGILEIRVLTRGAD
jgi:ABC-type sugar transport system permease subunit